MQHIGVNFTNFTCFFSVLSFSVKSLHTYSADIFVIFKPMSLWLPNRLWIDIILWQFSESFLIYLIR